MTAAVDIARRERVGYFDALWDGEHPLELRRREPDGAWRKDFADTPEQADHLAHKRVQQGADVYVGMVPRLERGLPLHDRAATRDQYAPARVLWTDHDTARSVTKLEMFDPSPTAVLYSGGTDQGVPRRYAVWAIAEPLAPDEEVKRQLKRLQHHLEADSKSTDAARILRVPGSRHHRTGRVCRLVEFTGEVHSLAALTGELEDAPDWTPPGTSPLAKTTDELVALFTGRYRDGEGRHDHFRSVVGVLLARCDRLPPDLLLELAVCWAQKHTTPCKPRAELERNFDNLLARERKRRGLT